MKKCCPTVTECCDMRGMLSFLILWLLNKRPMYGDEIAAAIGSLRGGKPTPGTIYPALKMLKEKKAINTEKKGRKVVYSITKEGRKGAEDAIEYFCKTFGQIFLEYKQIRSKR